MIPANSLYLAEIIRRRKWQLIVADERGQHFITSDHPVSGFLGQETRIPLSPEAAVVTSDQIETEVIQADDKHVRLLNWMTYTNAQACIYGDKVDDLFHHDMEELGKNPLLKPEIAYMKEALPHMNW
jgi:hypothetical protein